MLDNLIVALIVGVSAWYAASKYLPASWRKRLGRDGGAGCGSGCGSGCDSCNSCETPQTPAAPEGRRVIKIHTRV